MELKVIQEVLVDVSERYIDKFAAAVEFLFSTEFMDWEAFTVKTVVRQSNRDSIECEVLKEGKFVASFALNSFPACPYIAISTHAFVAESMRGQGIGSRLHALRIKAASLAGYHRLLATANASNKTEINILKHHGWKLVSTFPGYCPKESVTLWERIL